MTAVAIDGPAGAGKSTIARRAAEKLGFIYVDTGALYRSIGYYMFLHQIDVNQAEQVVSALKNISVSLKYVEKIQKVFLNQEDVSEKIRTPEMSMYASKVSAIPEVRSFLLGMQRELAEKNNVIMDGRDIGTVVLPKAEVKIFLTASSEDRAMRRYLEYTTKGEQVDYDCLLSEVRERDYQDENRAASPLRKAEDAILLDTTGNELADSVALVLDTIQEKLNL